MGAQKDATLQDLCVKFQLWKSTILLEVSEHFSSGQAHLGNMMHNFVPNDKFQLAFGQLEQSMHKHLTSLQQHLNSEAAKLELLSQNCAPLLSEFPKALASIEILRTMSSSAGSADLHETAKALANEEISACQA